MKIPPVETELFNEVSRKDEQKYRHVEANSLRQTSLIQFNTVYNECVF